MFEARYPLRESGADGQCEVRFGPSKASVANITEI